MKKKALNKSAFFINVILISSNNELPSYLKFFNNFIKVVRYLKRSESELS